MRSVPRWRRGADGDGGSGRRARARRRALAAAARCWAWCYAGYIVGCAVFALFEPSPRWGTATAYAAAAVWFGLYRAASRRADRAKAAAAARMLQVQQLVDPDGTSKIAVWLSRN